MAESLISRFS